MIERLAELMHEEWLAVMAEQGRHPPELCPHAREYPCSCPKCHDGMYEWADLPEQVKEVNRRGVLRFLRELGITPEAAARMEPGAVGKAVEAAERARYLLAEWGGSDVPGVDDELGKVLCALGEGVSGE